MMGVPPSHRRHPTLLSTTTPAAPAGTCSPAPLQADSPLAELLLWAERGEKEGPAQQDNELMLEKRH